MLREGKDATIVTYGASVSTAMKERNFFSLASPVKRVTGFDIPFPSPMLEKYQLPSVDRILDAVDEMTWED